MPVVLPPGRNPGTIGDVTGAVYDLDNEPELVAVLAGAPAPDHICIQRDDYDDVTLCWIADEGETAGAICGRRSGPRYLSVSDGRVITAEWSLGKFDIPRDVHAALVANPTAERVYRELIASTSLLAPIRSGDPKAYVQALIDAAFTLAADGPA